MNNFKGYVYIHRNRFTGETYVGATTKKPQIRWGRNGQGYKAQKRFWEDIQKYGWKNFEHIVVPQVYTTPEALNQAEKEMIEKLNSVENGYNINKGGNVNYLALRDKGRLRNTIPVKAINVDTDEVRSFYSLSEAARWMAENVATHIEPIQLFKKIQDITKGLRKSTYGYTFEYEGETK